MDRRNLITCGSAAGVVAAFRALVGGVCLLLKKQCHSTMVAPLCGKVSICFLAN
jgi:H+/Cl- antiporter ClcA